MTPTDPTTDVQLLERAQLAHSLHLHVTRTAVESIAYYGLERCSPVERSQEIQAIVAYAVVRGELYAHILPGQLLARDPALGLFVVLRHDRDDDELLVAVWVFSEQQLAFKFGIGVG